MDWRRIARGVGVVVLACVVIYAAAFAFFYFLADSGPDLLR